MVETVLNLGWGELFPIHRMSPYALLLYTLGNLAFLAYYLWRYLRNGILSFDSYFVIFKLYIPIVFFLPFSLSRANGIVATGAFHEVYQDHVETAFFICTLGIACFLVGAFFARFSRLGLPGYTTVTTSLRVFWLSRIGLTSTTLLVLALLVLMMGLCFEPGHARDTALRNPLLSPIYNVFHIVTPFVALNMLVRGYRTASPIFYALGTLLAAFGLFGGTRGASVGVFITFVFILLISTRAKNVLPPLLATAGLLIAAVYVSGFRSGEFGLSQISRLPVVLLYGNNFSDLRDFAWILSGWDFEYLGGKTQLAGLLAFIPSSLSEFRTTWSWGNFSTVTAGLSSEGHAGLRPTIFGEWFFNFGYLGVALSGFLAGFVVLKLTQYVQVFTRQLSARNSVIYVLGAFIYFSLFESLLITAGFFGFHIVFSFIVIGEIVFSAVRNSRQRGVMASR
jgi:hypothetical protein